MRLRPARLTFPIAFLLLVSAAATRPAAKASPQTGSPKGKIAAIHFTGSHKYAEAQIAGATGLRVGDVVGSEEIQAAADRLAQLGLFRAARFRFSTSGETITVEFEVEDAPTVPVSFDNFPWFDDVELTGALKQALPLFDGSAPEQGSLLDTMTETLQKLLAGRGIPAKVERALTAMPGGEGTMQQFKVIGAGMKIEAVRFGDALANESKSVQERLRDLVGKPFSRYAITVFISEQVRPVYLEKGYLRMAAGTPQVRMTGDPNRPLPDSVVVLIPIEPGPAYRWGGVEWRGNAAFGPAALDEFVGLKKDDTADGIRIARAWERVRSEYGRLGYLDVKVEPAPLFDEAARRVSHRVAITEGPQYRMGELVITGLSLVAEGKVREAWRLPRGAVFDRTYFEQILARLERARAEIFGELPLHYEQVGRWLRTNAETRTVDLLLDFH